MCISIRRALSFLEGFTFLHINLGFCQSPSDQSADVLTSRESHLLSRTRVKMFGTVNRSLTARDAAKQMQHLLTVLKLSYVKADVETKCSRNEGN